MALLDLARETCFAPTEPGVILKIDSPTTPPEESDDLGSPGATSTATSHTYYLERLPENRCPTAFRRTKNAIQAFKTSIPAEFVDPVRRNKFAQAVVDVDLVTLHSFVAAAEICLNEPKEGYYTTPAALSAARRIMSLVTAIPEGSYRHLHIYMAMILSKFVGKTFISEIAKLTKEEDHFGRSRGVGPQR